MGTEDTTRLLHEARAGSERALDDLHRRAASRLLPLVRLRMGRKLSGDADAEDVVQAALLKAFRGWDSFHEERGASFMAWAWRIAENELRDRVDHAHRLRRDAQVNVPLDDAAEIAASRARSALSLVILDEQARRVERALARLADEHREVVLLRQYEELPFADVGRRMSRSEDAARMLFARAMTALTMALTEDE